MLEAGKAQAGAKEMAEGLWGTSESEKTVAVNTPASAGAQQTLPAVPSLTRVAMGPDVRNVNADHSKANIAQENIIVNYPAGLLSLPVFFRKEQLQQFSFHYWKI